VDKVRNPIDFAPSGVPSHDNLTGADFAVQVVHGAMEIHFNTHIVIDLIGSRHFFHYFVVRHWETILNLYNTVVLLAQKCANHTLLALISAAEVIKDCENYRWMYLA
jgi:hypothetical protein